MQQNKFSKLLWLIAITSTLLLLSGCNNTPKTTIGKDFSEKREQIKIAMNTFQKEEIEKAIKILESMNELEQKEVLAWLPANKSASLQDMRIYYLLVQHTKNQHIYRVTNGDSVETKKAFNLLMKTLKFDKSAIKDLYQQHNMDFFQEIIKKMARKIKEGHNYSEDEIFRMVQSQNGMLKKYLIDIGNYFPEESTLYKNEKISTAQSIEELEKERIEQEKKERAYKLKVSRMTPVKFYMVKKFKNNIVFHSFKTVTNDKNLKKIDVDYKINEQGKKQFYSFSYNVHNSKRGLIHTKIDCYMSDVKKTYINDFKEFKRIHFFKTGVIKLDHGKSKNLNYYVVKIIKETTEARFIKNNFETLKKEIAQGKGEKLDILSKFYPIQDLKRWKLMLQKNYTKIFRQNPSYMDNYMEGIHQTIFMLTIFNTPNPYDSSDGVLVTPIVPTHR